MATFEAAEKKAFQKHCQPASSPFPSPHPTPDGSVVSLSNSRPRGCEFDPPLRRTFFPAYFRLSPLQKHVRKAVSGFGKKSCVSTGVREPGNTCASPTAMKKMTFAVKVALNPNTNKQTKPFPKCVLYSDVSETCIPRIINPFPKIPLEILREKEKMIVISILFLFYNTICPIREKSYYFWYIMIL